MGIGTLLGRVLMNSGLSRSRITNRRALLKRAGAVGLVSTALAAVPSRIALGQEESSAGIVGTWLVKNAAPGAVQRGHFVAPQARAVQRQHQRTCAQRKETGRTVIVRGARNGTFGDPGHERIQTGVDLAPEIVASAERLAQAEAELLEG
jgi:hypothetical protein